jgi:hypothetical protein
VRLWVHVRRQKNGCATAERTSCNILTLKLSRHHGESIPSLRSIALMSLQGKQNVETFQTHLHDRLDKHVRQPPDHVVMMIVVSPLTGRIGRGRAKVRRSEARHVERGVDSVPQSVNKSQHMNLGCVCDGCATRSQAICGGGTSRQV